VEEGLHVDEVSAEAWRRTIGFYRELIEYHGWRQTPMLEFVEWLASSHYSRLLHPSHSHAALGLSTVPTYQHRLRGPMVYVVYYETAGFVVRWQLGQGAEVREEVAPSPQAPEVFDRILGWLGVSVRMNAEPGPAADGEEGLVSEHTWLGTGDS
jgi:hypothetical protein